MDEEVPPAKRPRLSMACNACRRRKVKCDTDYPKCRNCRLRDDVCTTTDPKMPQVAVIREWIIQSEPAQDDSTLREPNDGRRAAQTVSHSPGSLSTIRRPDVVQPAGNSPAVSIPRSHDVGISPAQQPYEMTFNTDAQTNRIKMMGSSSSQCLVKSLDVYLESAQIQPLSHNFRHGMRHAEELNIPLGASLPALPETTLCNRYVSVFFDKIHPIYPLFDIDNMKSTIQHFANIPSVHSVSHEQGPLLVSAYLILSLGADESAQGITVDGTKYLEAAASLLGHVVSMPYLHAIQALLLFTITYRGRDSDGLGWQTVGMAIRIAYTLGLHRHSHSNPSNQHGVQNKLDRLFHARIWAICCCLEKMMQLESGRPAAIVKVDRDHMIGPDQRPPGHDFLQWHMGLAEHQGLICHHIYGHKPGERTAQGILSDTARLDRSLLSWAREIPEEFRPGNDLFCSNSEFHFAALLSIQYYQALIALHRAALIAPTATFQSEVTKHNFDDSSKLRLLAGEAICVSSARSIARLTIELSDRNVQSRILTAGPPLMACIVLGIALIKNAGSRSMAADLELLKACAEYTADQFSKSGHIVPFIKGVLTIYQQVKSYIDRISQKEQTRTAESRSQSDHAAGAHATYQILPETQSVVQPQGGEMPYDQSPHASTQRPDTTMSRNHENNADHLPPHNEISNLDMNLNMTAPVMNSYAPRFHSNGSELPFDNLDVQELWDWMGNLSDYDNYSYQGSY
ncbi:fungal-specific transcription factor domain-containing protein [Rhexocercosporidium sp. MPI-PUGE-AT-0058]|nr:fungal-specific transcription factor domain-containing protein [Rhexocercosporidium sp. MPI-PUGE-AT-0058]